MFQTTNHLLDVFALVSSSGMLGSNCTGGHIWKHLVVELVECHVNLLGPGICYKGHNQALAHRSSPWNVDILHTLTTLVSLEHTSKNSEAETRPSGSPHTLLFSQK